MYDAHWTLLARYTVILNYIAKKNGRRQVGVVRAASAILASFLGNRSDTINKEFWDVLCKLQKESISLCYGPEHLDAIATAAGIESIELLTVGKGGRNKRKKLGDAHKATEAIRSGGRPKDSVPRGPGRPRKVSSEHAEATNPASDRSKEAKGPNTRGGKATGSQRGKPIAAKDYKGWWKAGSTTPAATGSTGAPRTH